MNQLVNQIPEEQSENFKKIFSRYDENNEGFIQAEMLGTAMLSLGQNPWDAQIRALLKKVNVGEHEAIDLFSFLYIIASSFHVRQTVVCARLG